MDVRFTTVKRADRSQELVAALAGVWEGSVRATHAFLAEPDVVALRPEVRAGLQGVDVLDVACEGDEPCAFAGVHAGKLEMLFVAPRMRGRGIGSALLKRAVELHGAVSLDVNEQNPQAVGFYEHEGFVVSGRSDADDAGRPFPILHLSLAPARPQDADV